MSAILTKKMAFAFILQRGNLANFSKNKRLGYKKLIPCEGGIRRGQIARANRPIGWLEKTHIAHIKEEK